MTDIETLGTRPGCIVLGAAFVRFSDEAQIAFNLSIPDQQALGLEIDPATHAWWGEQEAKFPGVWESATRNPVPLRTGLEYIAQWIAWASGGDRVFIWCHGATFDAPLLGELFRRAGIACPWQFYDVRDTRTLYDLAGIDVKDYAVPPPHVALNDAIGQVRAANAALAALAPKPAMRFFHHPDSDSFFFTNDGSRPNDPLVNEINPGEYLRGARMAA
jgi:hypothetical protein